MATVIYARKSSESEERQVQSLDDQIRVLQEFARKESIQVQEVIQEARSAKTPYTRPEFQRLIKQVEAGRIDSIFTWSINRLSRNMIDGGIIAHLLQTGRLQFIRTPERMYRPEDNVLIMSIENGMATSYVQDLSRNVKRGLLGKVERGWYPGAAPIGYQNTIDHEVEPHPTTYPLVEHGWKMLLSGQYTVAEIHRELVALGLKGLYKANRERPVSKNVVYNIFSNRFYCGDIVFKGKVYPGKHKPMISPAEFEQAEYLLDKRKVIRPQKYEFSFAGTMTCGTCGCAIVGEEKRKATQAGNVTRYTYYHCTGAKGCTRRSVSEEKLFDILEKAIQKLNLDSDFIEWCEESLKHSSVRDDSTRFESKAHIESEIHRTQRQQQELLNMRLNGELTPDEFIETKRHLSALEEQAKRELGNLSIDESMLRQAIVAKLEGAQTLRGARSMTPRGLRGQLNALGMNHTMTDGRPHIVIDPIIQKIAGFEPRATCSERSKPDDYFAKNPDWLGILADVRKIARAKFLQDVN